MQIKEWRDWLFLEKIPVSGEGQGKGAAVGPAIDKPPVAAQPERGVPGSARRV